MISRSAVKGRSGHTKVPLRHVPTGAAKYASRKDVEKRKSNCPFFKPTHDTAVQQNSLNLSINNYAHRRISASCQLGQWDYRVFEP